MWWRPPIYGLTAAGLVGIVQGADLDDVKTHLGRLPFVANGLMAFEYAEVVPL